MTLPPSSDLNSDSEPPTQLAHQVGVIATHVDQLEKSLSQLSVQMGNLSTDLRHVAASMTVSSESIPSSLEEKSAVDTAHSAEGRIQIDHEVQEHHPPSVTKKITSDNPPESVPYHHQSDAASVLYHKSTPLEENLTPIEPSSDTPSESKPKPTITNPGEDLHEEYSDPLLNALHQGGTVKSKSKTPKPKPPRKPVANNAKHSSSNGGEFQWGVTWLSRIGMGLVFMGLLIGAGYSFPHLSPLMKVLVVGLMGLVFLFSGYKLEHNHKTLSRILEGGGLAIGFLALYGAGFIPGMDVLAGSPLAWPLVGMYTLAAMGYAAWRGSQILLGLTTLLGYITCIEKGFGWSSTIGVLLLHGAALAVCFRFKQWRFVPAMIVFFAVFLNAFTVGAANFIGGISHHYPFPLDGDRAVFLWGHWLLITAFVTFRDPNRFGAVLASATTLGLAFMYSASMEDTAIKTLVLSLLMLYHGAMATLAHPAVNSTVVNHQGFWRHHAILSASLLPWATMTWFESDTLAAILALEALVLCGAGRFLSTEGDVDPFRAIGITLSILCWFVSLFIYFGQLGNYSQLELVATTLIISLSLMVWEDRLIPLKNTTTAVLCMGLALFIYVGGMFEALPKEWETTSLVGFGFALLFVGFQTFSRKYRAAGLVVLALALGRVILVDWLTLSVPFQILSFVGLGLVLLGGSFGYSKLLQRQDAILQASQPSSASTPSQS